MSATPDHRYGHCAGCGDLQALLFPTAPDRYRCDECFERETGKRAPSYSATTCGCYYCRDAPRDVYPA